MNAIGIICGTGFKNSDEFNLIEKVNIETPWGDPSSPLYVGKIGAKKVVLLLRHGEDRTIPPHRINHRANIYAMKNETSVVIGISSTGALHSEIPVPSLSIPVDYVNLWGDLTYYDETIKHITPGFPLDLRNKMISTVKKLDLSMPVRTEDVYVQTTGPRLETMAEVRFLSTLGDLVGMTMASEATLCKEIGLDYSSLLTVDNYGNGIGTQEVRYDDIVENAKKSWTCIMQILKNFLEEG